MIQGLTDNRFLVLEMAIENATLAESICPRFLILARHWYEIPLERRYLRSLGLRTLTDSLPFTIDTNMPSTMERVILAQVIVFPTRFIMLANVFN